ncbi:MAG: D-alanine-D-alanine ligase [Halieaceae bacterium]|jgi:D-alanine-D-alanine ligase
MSPTDLRQLTIALLFGGRSLEREVSLASAREVRAALLEGGYTPRDIDTGEAQWWRHLDGVDLALNMQHGRGGEDGVTQGLLAALGIPGTGSDVLGSALAMDKVRSKQLWQAAGLPTAPFQLLSAETDFAEILARWGSAFVKPAGEGSSLGMTRVDTPAAFADAYTLAAQHDRRVFAEQFIDGPEYTVAVLGERALPPIRIESSGSFYDYAAKYEADSTRYYIPCGLDEQQEARIRTLSLRAFEVLGCSVWGRVDLMRDASGIFQLLEVNTIPGMTDHSLVPMAARAVGMSLLELVEAIMRLTLAGPSAGGGH